jgi:hypothetical protein
MLGERVGSREAGGILFAFLSVIALSAESKVPKQTADP